MVGSTALVHSQIAMLTLSRAALLPSFRLSRTGVGAISIDFQGLPP